MTETGTVVHVEVRDHNPPELQAANVAVWLIVVYLVSWALRTTARAVWRARAIRREARA